MNIKPHRKLYLRVSFLCIHQQVELDAKVLYKQQQEKKHERAVYFSVDGTESFPS